MVKWIRDTEAIFGMARVGSVDTKPSLTVAVNPDTNRIGDPYLKCYNASRYDTADCVTRLSFYAPKKVFHRNRDGKKEWILNSDDKDAICEFLDSPSKDYSNDKITYWLVSLYSWNNECSLLNGEFPEQYSTKIEAFIDGFYDKENRDNPNYVPSTTLRPDYTQVRNKRSK